ncbi:MAG: putative ATPase, partial [Solidesulfovibrio magneticus str. Maddingley MBC34]
PKLVSKKTLSRSSVPETINHKYKKSVTVERMVDNRYTIDDLCKSFSNDNTGSITKADNSENSKEVIANYDIEIDDLRTTTEYFFLKSGCKWIEYCEQNSRNLSEPEWYTLLSIVSRIENGKQYCHEISQNYKSYSYHETEDKILQTSDKGGPCKCNYIESYLHNKTCEKCKLKHIINSPIELCKKNVFNLNREKFIEFNRKHAAISIAGKSLIINYNEIDQRSKLKTFSISSYDDFNKRYLPLLGKTINKKGEIVVDEKFTKIWLNSNYRKDFPNGIVFSPNADVEGAYNLWQGFAVQPKETGDWSLYIKHIMEVICDNKPEIYNYVFAWMANIVQNLGSNRPGTAIVLRGERGTGKSIFADIFGKIFGGHYMTVTQKNHLVGKFNNHLCNKVLVFADEAIYSGDKESNEILKTLITGNTLTVEKKGIDAVVVPNNISLIIAGNNNELVNAGTSERRYLVLELSNIHKQDHQYFEDMIKQMENGGYEKMLYDLQNYDINCVNLRNVPKTAYLFDQLLGAWHDKPIQKFIFEYLTENVDLIEENNHEIKTSALYDRFIDWVSTNKTKVVDKSNFQKTFNKYIGSKLITKGSNKEKFTILPSLDEGRKHFQNAIGMDIPWNDFM